MIVLGLDPGSQRTGFAVLDVGGRTPVLRDLGVFYLVKGSRRPDLGVRLEELYEDLSTLVTKWNPALIGLEKVVTFKSAVSAHVLSEARGVIRLVLYQKLDRASDRLIELSPTRIKKFATGSGRAGKDDILKALQMRFRGLRTEDLDTSLSPDAFDAVAIAWTAWIQQKTRLKP